MQTCSGDTVWKAAVFDMKRILSGQAQDTASHSSPTGAGRGEQRGRCAFVQTSLLGYNQGQLLH